MRVFPRRRQPLYGPLLALALCAELWAGNASALTPAPPSISCALPSGPLPTRTRAVFLLDTSGSMRGFGDGKADIFKRVKQAILAYVESAKPDQLEVMTFDSGLHQHRSYQLPGDQPRLASDLKALTAEGSNTYLYSSLNAALSPLKGDGGFMTNVYVLTDGIDNEVGGKVTAQQAISSFKNRGPLDSLTYIALGTAIPQEAQQAILHSDYASGLTMPVGGVPDLVGDGIGTGRVIVTDANHVPAPYADGTPLNLSSHVSGLDLLDHTAHGGVASLRAPARLPYGTPALLCAPRAITPGAKLIGGRPRYTLLELNLGQEGTGMRWLNPGADRALNPGESVTLRYWAAPTLNLEGPLVGLHLPAGANGLDGSVERLPSSRFFTVRLRNTGSQVSQNITPRLMLGSGRSVELPAISVGTGTAPAGTPPNVLAPTEPDPSVQGRRGVAAWKIGLLALVLLGLALLGFGLLLRRARRPRKPVVPQLIGTAIPTVKGIEYGEDRLLSLVSDRGEVSSVQTPLGGPFDLGMLAKVPLLSGMRAEQNLDGMRLLNIPADIEVSQGTRLLHAGDLIRPGTLLGVAIAQRARAPHAPLGSLVGLGLPLTLRTEGVTLHVCGPYGVHALMIHPGITDLGDEFRAPALTGLKVSVSGPNILLADLPHGMTITRPGEDAPLRPGTYLPAESLLTLPEA